VRTTREIPSLDGLRAFSIALVILSHSFSGSSRLSGYQSLEISLLGQYGVDIFFVISGFLITYLLVKEINATGTISLKRFYLRRFFRIFPAFYVFLLVLAILWGTGVVAIDLHTYIRVATYTSNYYRGASGWLLGHCWSLSLEEQFYLLWPPCLALFGKRTSAFLAFGIIVLSPASRLISYVLAPSFRGMEGIMLHTRLDTIMFGCAIALVYDHQVFDRLLKKFLHPALAMFAAFFFLVLSPYIEARFAARFTWPIGYTLRGVCVSVVLLYVVRNPVSVAGRFLNSRLIRHLGVVSYSLYLWQQLFTGPRTFWFPLNLLAILACAEASFFLIERPAFKLRDLIESRVRAFSKPDVLALEPPPSAS
jgi:peptidoglycan/LPS O-acetylase OafA/YrhL